MVGMGGRVGGGVMGGGMMAGAGGALKRPLDSGGLDSSGAMGGDAAKRARVEEPVVPPEQEVLPEEGVSPDLDTLRRRFEALQDEVRGWRAGRPRRGGRKHRVAAWRAACVAAARANVSRWPSRSGPC